MDLREARYTCGKRHPWETVRFEVVLEILKSSFPSIFSGEKLLLDIGCGDAYVSGRLLELMPHARIIALDTSLDREKGTAITSAIGSSRISFFSSVEEALKAAGTAFDVVLMLDVLEHVEDDRGFLLSLCNSPAVTDDTIFLITAPAFQALFSGHDRFLGHFRRYDRNSLHGTVRSAGLRVVRSGYFFWSLLSFRWLQKWYWKFFGMGGSYRGAGAWNGGKLVEFIMRSMLMLDLRISRATGFKLPGLSVFMVCRRSA